MTTSPRRLGILCGGGPAPGMNSVISAATIEARNSGWEVIGIPDGFQHLMAGDPSPARELEIRDVSRIHLLGGSILNTSRANPTRKEEDLQRCVWTLGELRLSSLITIGGDDTAYSASRIAQATDRTFRVAHVPKTIDNDLPLPSGMPTFGYQTARHVGVHLVNNLMTDAMTTKRWFFVVAMGRSAGHLALGIGKAAGATLAVIAEEFPREELPLDHLVDVLECAMLKRIAHGRPFGVAILAEGLGLSLPEAELEAASPTLERDEHGHIRLAELHLHRLLTDLVKQRFKERGEKVTIVAKNIGYELRCAPPIPFDIEYTRDLGYGAVEILRRLEARDSDEIGGMVTVQDGKIVRVPFGSFTDPDTGRPQVRKVNVNTESYRVAREYMIRLEREDLEDPVALAAIAAARGMTVQEFRKRYEHVVEESLYRQASAS